MMTPNDNTRTPRRNRAFWQQHTDQWKASGLSKIAYSKEHSLKPMSFYNWSKKLEHVDNGEQAASGINTSTTFLPVQIDHDSASLKQQRQTQFVHIERAATDIALPVDLNPEQIEHWLRAIHTLHV